MAIRGIFACAGIAIAFYFYSCGDNSTGSNDDGSGWFPNTVGMLWVYEVHDSLTQTTDTVYISITDTAQSQQAVPPLLWRTYWMTRDSTVNRWATTSGDTIDFVIDPPEHSESVPERLVLPLKVGKQWSVTEFDTSTVLEIGPTTVPAGYFSQVALVEEQYHQPGGGATAKIRTWIGRRAGIVARYEYFAALVSQQLTVQVNRSWRLIRYDLTTFSTRQFPLSVGTSWRYEVRDTMTNEVDTVEARIRQRAEVSWADSALVLYYESRTSRDSLFILVSDGSVFLAHDTIFYPLVDWSYAFPLSVGRHWGYDYIYYTPPVIDDKVPITVLGRHYRTSFHYKAIGGDFESFWKVEEWLVPGVGPVKRRISTFYGGPPQTTEWTLIPLSPI